MNGACKVWLVVALFLLESVCPTFAGEKWILWTHQYGSANWEKWTPGMEFETRGDCDATVSRMLAGIRPPDRLAGDAMLTPTPSGGELYTRPVCFSDTFDPRGSRRK
jgi:hypothetical protein